uniref:Uncharacterized protein n=1 Tax=Aegilops tauschii TaxID=37682 RepID=M8BDH0_AEGTA
MEEHRGEMTRWLDVLAAKGVEELIFVNRPWPLDLRLPATIFSCGASLTRLYLGVWRLPDMAAVPRGAGFPKLRELGLCMTVMEDCDLAFMLERSPVLEFLVIMASQTGVRLRLVSQSLRCVQLDYTHLKDIDVVDAPRLERLFQCTTFLESELTATSLSPMNCSSRIKIGHAPNLRVLGYLQPGEQELGISNTVIVAGNKESIIPNLICMCSCAVSINNTPNLSSQLAVYLSLVALQAGTKESIVPSVQILAIESPTISEEPTGKVNIKFWQEGAPIKCVAQSMKKVFFYEFRGSRSEVVFLKFLAERGRVLEQMVVVVASECFTSGSGYVNDKLKPLISAKWSSKGCKLQLFKSPVGEGSGPAYSHELASDFGFPDPFDLKYYYKAERISFLCLNSEHTHLTGKSDIKDTLEQQSIG